MFLLMTRVPPALAAVTIALAHLAVLFDIAIRRDLPWWRRLVTALIWPCCCRSARSSISCYGLSAAEWSSESRVGGRTSLPRAG